MDVDVRVRAVQDSQQVRKAPGRYPLGRNAQNVGSRNGSSHGPSAGRAGWLAAAAADENDDRAVHTTLAEVNVGGGRRARQVGIAQAICERTGVHGRGENARPVTQDRGHLLESR